MKNETDYIQEFQPSTSSTQDIVQLIKTRTDLAFTKML